MAYFSRDRVQLEAIEQRREEYATMPCYIIGEVQVIDPAEMERYLPLVRASKEKYGGRYLVRGAKPLVLEGAPAQRINITEFDDREAALRWWNSPEYAEAKAIRKQASNARALLVDGGGDGAIVLE